MGKGNWNVISAGISNDNRTDKEFMKQSTWNSDRRGLKPKIHRWEPLIFWREATSKDYFARPSVLTDSLSLVFEDQ